MIDPFFGSVLSAAANIGGGILGSVNSRVANERAADQAANNLAKQEEFARNAIRWRAQDVMRAYAETGIHPLAMLGVQGPTYTPVTAAFTADTSLGSGIAAAGQDISRGIHATADRELRAKSLEMQETMLNNQAERGQLENESLRLQILSQRMRIAQQANPPMPSPNQSWAIPGQVPDTTMLHRDMAVRRDATREDVSTPGVGLIAMPDGSLMPVKSKDAQERLEDDWMGNLKHFVLRELGPSFWESNPGRAAAPGMRWTVNFWGNWVQVPIRKSFTSPEWQRALPRFGDPGRR